MILLQLYPEKGYDAFFQLRQLSGFIAGLQDDHVLVALLERLESRKTEWTQREGSLIATACLLDDYLTCQLKPVQGAVIVRVVRVGEIDPVDLFAVYANGTVQDILPDLEGVNRLSAHSLFVIQQLLQNASVATR